MSFTHRNNHNGTWDSTCLRCHRTVATTSNPYWLHVTERRHVCALSDLHLFVEDRHEYSSIACQDRSVTDVVSKTCRIIPINSPHRK